MIDHAKQQCPPEVDTSIYSKQVRTRERIRVSYTSDMYVDTFKNTVTQDEKFNQVSVTKQALMEACHFTEQNIS